jgi:hypothetical protein
VCMHVLVHLNHWYSIADRGLLKTHPTLILSRDRKLEVRKGIGLDLPEHLNYLAMKLYASMCLVMAMFGSLQALSSTGPIDTSMRHEATRSNKMQVTTQCSTGRSQFLRTFLLVATTGLLDVVPQASLAKSFSTNARNLDRINAGDFSGGSVYDNNPATTRARRRRALQGCKIPVAREEASESLGMNGVISERDCNLRVMDDSPEFMLSALQTLECPTCPYGVKSSR